MPNEPNKPDRDQPQKPQRQPAREDPFESTAEDRGRNPERRGFAGDREADELGSELERESGVENDDEDMDDTGRRDR
jgi:hypothetical protein